jgi:hypothetical protein
MTTVVLIGVLIFGLYTDPQATLAALFLLALIFGGTFLAVVTAEIIVFLFKP